MKKQIRIICGTCGWKFRGPKEAVSPENESILCPQCDTNDLQEDNKYLGIEFSGVKILVNLQDKTVEALDSRKKNAEWSYFLNYVYGETVFDDNNNLIVKE